MSIDIQSERLIGLDEAAKLFPGRDGGSVHKITVGLYARRGKLGVRLETVLAGPRRCTSIEAVDRFIKAITAASETKSPRPDRAPIANRTKQEAARAVRRANKELKASGA
ncbi:MAG: DUF1580 domain-containing protein [Isosphaeraceae bacterium]|jgi:hypothetical protein